MVIGSFSFPTHANDFVDLDDINVTLTFDEAFKLYLEQYDVPPDEVTFQSHGELIYSSLSIDGYVQETPKCFSPYNVASNSWEPFQSTRTYNVFVTIATQSIRVYDIRIMTSGHYNPWTMEYRIEWHSVFLLNFAPGITDARITSYWFTQTLPHFPRLGFNASFRSNGATVNHSGNFSII